MKKSLIEQIIEFKLKERLKIVKKNKLENYSSIEQQLENTGFYKTGTFSFEDPTLKITHNKSVYVLSESGLILTLYYVSNKNGIKIPMQLTVCGQYRNGNYTKISCKGQNDNLMSDFIDSKISVLNSNCNAIWTTIDSHFDLLDDYDSLFISRQVNNYDEFNEYFTNNFYLYNLVYDNAHTYNTILNQVQCAELNNNSKNIRTNLYVVTSEQIAQIMGIELTNIKINQTKSLYTGLVLSMNKYTDLDNLVEEKINDKNLLSRCSSSAKPEDELSF